MIGRTFFRSAQALLPPHECGGSHQKSLQWKLECQLFTRGFAGRRRRELACRGAAERKEPGRLGQSRQIFQLASQLRARRVARPRAGCEKSRSASGKTLVAGARAAPEFARRRKRRARKLARLRSRRPGAK